MTNTIIMMINPLMAAIFAAIFFGLWLRDRSRIAVLCFSVSHFLLCAGFLVFQFAPDPEAITWILLMHTIYSLGTATLCWGVARRVGQNLSITLCVAVYVISSIVIVAASFGENMNPRLIATNTAYGIIFALTAQLLGRSGSRRWIDTAIFWFIILGAFQFFVRPQLAMIAGGPMSAGNYRSSDFYAIWVLWMGSKALLQALALVGATISDHWRAEKEVAEIDPLSGLKMRRSFESAAMQMLDQNVDNNASVCMIVADIDHFKRVNDIWGHQAGDEAIKAFGELIGNTVRATDLCGRIGGEEFCILVYDCPASAAEGLANRIRRKFATMEHEALGPDIRITASFGVSQWRPGEGYGKLFARADAALYRAKSSGRDIVCSKGEGDERRAIPSNDSGESKPAESKDVSTVASLSR